MSELETLYRAETWSNPEFVHDIFSELRREKSIPFVESNQYPDFWHISKHQDIFEIERRTDIFLSAPRTNIQTRQTEAEGLVRSGGKSRLRTLVSMDPPEHPKMRMLTQNWFMPKNLSRLQTSIEESAERGLDRFVELNGACDFAQDVGVEFPLRVIMTILGVPPEDYSSMLRLTQELFGSEDPDLRRRGDTHSDPELTKLATYMDFGQYFLKMTEDRRKNPRDDLATLIANARVDGEPIDDASTFGYYLIAATAGHDTTSYSLIEAVHQLALDPDLLARLKQDPDSMSKKIAEEAIRFASPVRHFVRTAKADYELRGKTIRAGDSVILWYPSGSRDEDIFEDPHAFNPDRDTSVRHASFGHGAHMCLGMHLARQEISTFLRMLCERTDSIELTGEPLYAQANFVSGIKKLLVKAALVSDSSLSDRSPDFPSGGIASHEEQNQSAL